MSEPRVLEGRTALVFGAGSSGPGVGNGKAAALAYARAGANVVAVDVNGDAAWQTRDSIAEEGGTAIALTADVTNSDEVAKAVGAAREAYRTLDILHNNVGIGTFGGPVELAEADWDRTIEINMKGAFLACKHALPPMLEQGGGVITNISSIASLGVSPFPFVAYAASKAGLDHLTRSIAVQYAGQGIRANAILPGVIDTPMVRGSAAMSEHFGGDVEAALRERDKMSPTGKSSTAWDVAAAAVFLASDAANYINGVLLPVDGGLSCRMS